MSRNDCNDDDDFFGDSESFSAESLDSATTRKITGKLYNEGYRAGKIEEEERQMQIGFDEGFVHGMRAGKFCGDLYGACRATLDTTCSLDGNLAMSLEFIEYILFEKFPESESIEEEDMEQLQLHVNTISHSLDDAFQTFRMQFAEWVV